MGRLPRPTGDDLIYHAINRGNNRADVLGPDGERDMFLGDLARTKARYPFALFGYCLMSNHFHLLLKPAPGQSISRILQSLTVAHTWRHHRRQGTSGHVWQGRFRSPVVQDGDHLLVVLRYIEANPVRAAMVADPASLPGRATAAMAPGMPIPSWTRSRNGSSSVALSRNVGPAGDGRSVGNNRPRSWIACGRRCAVAGPTVQRTGSRSFPIASASSVSRAVVVVRHAKRCSDIAPRSSGKENRYNRETFRRNSAGNQSRPEEPGQQPEASLA